MENRISSRLKQDLNRIIAGVLQGDTLAPYLFAIVIDYCLRKAISGDEERLGFTLEQRKSRRVGSKNITDVDFADDIALLSEDIRTATELLHRVESAAANIGLFVNVDKTKVMTLNIEEQAGDLLSRSGGIIVNVEDFIYLGSWIDGTERDIKVRKGKAWAALHRLRNIWNSKLSQKLKIRLFIAACESMAILGELSFAANSRELCANSPAVRRHLYSAELRRTFAGVRRSSLEFARVRAYSAANWRTVRQKIRSRDEIPTTSNERSPRTSFAANGVHREPRSPIANCSSLKSVFWME